ncbi:hypothetical protein SF1_42370 [Sphingobacterium faecium NBRC 15299]|uniref:hypothetical protein n=1 Tax=Sphingobacterium faecium TaxID=34087 RepID=UPI000D33939D|nr:hypothetical protein [Sphingobacterium faecium]PTX10187.1 hypothetical protein C8N37_105195 [Sphingobacterium faecium]GEM66255.1 hypothetical protein SF1_42370 [Sphingobacterium faecium NBRC 15299]
MKFKLIKGEVEEFAILEDKLPDDIDKLLINCNIQAKVNIDEKIIGITNAVKYSLESKTLLKIKSTLYFKIHEDSWSEFERDTTVVLKKDKVQHFGIIAIGATRGMLIVKTVNTPYSSILLPPLNINKIIDDDIILEVK